MDVFFIVFLFVFIFFSYASNIGNAANELLKETNYWPDDGQYKQERDAFIAVLEQFDKGPVLLMWLWPRWILCKVIRRNVDIWLLPH